MTNDPIAHPAPPGGPDADQIDRIKEWLRRASEFLAEPEEQAEIAELITLVSGLSCPQTPKEPEPTAKELHLFDVYHSLGVPWGDDVFSAIERFRSSERELSHRYVKLRVKLQPFGALDTTTGGADRFAKTEAALDAVLSELAILRASRADSGLSRPPVAGAWQPIETRPECRKVEVFWVNKHGKSRRTFASFWPVGQLDMGDDVSDDDVDEEGKNTNAGWWEESEANDESMFRLIESLTHWRELSPGPLPSSPYPAEER